jgi:PPOX class probable F420-dependent enzyme
MLTNLTPTDLAELLEQPLIAVLATRRPDDTVMLSPVWFEWHDNGFNVWVPTPTGGKVSHVERDSRASIVVSNSDWPYKGLEVRGEARVLRDPATFYEVLDRTARRYYGDERGASMVDGYPEPGVVIRLEPGAVRGWSYEDEA